MGREGGWRRGLRLDKRETRVGVGGPAVCIGVAPRVSFLCFMGF